MVVVTAALHDLLRAVNDLYVAGYEGASDHPIKGYLQILAVFLWVAGTVTALSLLLGRSPVFLLSGLGALTAILLLVFRNTILSLVASVQIATNDMIRLGDWIEMPQMKADGDVIDIGLHAVTVRNWDRTVTHVPTHKFLEEPFRNWRGMVEAGGRRIKRALHVDMNTVRFLTEEEVEELERLEPLHDYLRRKREELAAYHAEEGERRGVRRPPRRLTNVGTFRAYVTGYLKLHPGIHQGMTRLVRQLQPGPHGLPLEVYCFTADTAWTAHETVQADLFDHLLSIAPGFGLRVYQEPAGSDFASLLRATGEN